MLSASAFKKITGVSRNADQAVLIARLSEHVEHETISATAQCLIIAELVEVWTWSAADGGKSVGLSESTGRLRASVGKVLRHMPERSLQITYTYLVKASSETRDAMKAAIATSKTDTDAARTVYEMFVAAMVAQTLKGKPEDHAKTTARIIKKGLRTVAEIIESIPAMAKADGIKMPARDGAPGSAADKKSDTAPVITKAADALTAFIADRQKGTDEKTPFAVRDDEATTLETTVLTMITTLLSAGRAEQVEAIRDEITDMIHAQHAKDADRAAGDALAADLKANAMGARANS
jgi:hypothetical protein